MAAWSANDVKGFAPEFSALSADTIDVYCAHAASLINADVLGAKTRLGGILLTAHLMTLCPPEGVATSGQIVTSRKVGEVSVTYAAASEVAKGSALALSRYGVLFAQLARGACAGGLVL